MIHIIGAPTVYVLSGEQVATSAIGSLQPPMAKVAYAVSFIGLLGTVLIFGMTSARFLHVLFLRQFKTLLYRKDLSECRPSTASTSLLPIGKKIDRGVWVFSVGLFWIVVWNLANAIPVFNSLLNISSSLLLSWFTWGVTVLFWFHLNWYGKWRSSGKKLVVAALNVIILRLVFFLTIPGTYASIETLLGIFVDPNVQLNGAFTCQLRKFDSY